MKKSQLLNKFNTAIDKLYDTLYDVRDVLDKYEDEELDELAQQFVEQVELCIAEGEVSCGDIREFLEECE